MFALEKSVMKVSRDPPNVSIIDFVAECKQYMTVEKVNAVLIKAAEGELKGILAG